MKNKFINFRLCRRCHSVPMEELPTTGITVCLVLKRKSVQNIISTRMEARTSADTTTIIKNRQLITLVFSPRSM